MGVFQGVGEGLIFMIKNVLNFRIALILKLDNNEDTYEKTMNIKLSYIDGDQ